MQELTDANERLKQDIERRKELEQQRRNFFIAVSHELKTPLTILKGQIENMILGYGDYKDHEKYLPQAFDSAERIEQLVREIIAITKTENTDISGSLCDVSLAETVSETVETIAPLAEKKHIRYLGDAELCRKIDASGLSLEEYLGITSVYAD